jgi:alkenylglycerophosphocholine hydrolase
MWFGTNEAISMHILPYVVLSLGAIALTVFLNDRDRKGSVKALLLKTVTSYLFILLAFVSFMINPRPGITVFFGLIALGLICGLIGDIVLDLKTLYPESASPYQHLGMVAFLIGHLFYLSALLVYFGFNWIPLIAAVVTGLAIILVSIYILKVDFKEHTIDSYLYAFFLSYMMAQACYAAVIQSFTAATLLLSIGSVSFLLSDVLLIGIYYRNKDSKAYIVLNHVLYYGAQYSIALSILYFVV